MRKWLSIFLIVVFAFAATLAPSVSQAMPHVEKSSEKQASGDHDCHGHAVAKGVEKQPQADKDSDPKCCDKGACKCVGGTCHNGLSKIFSNGGNPPIALFSAATKIDFADENTESVLSQGLKRPPRA